MKITADSLRNKKPKHKNESKKLDKILMACNEAAGAGHEGIRLSFNISDYISKELIKRGFSCDNEDGVKYSLTPASWISWTEEEYVVQTCYPWYKL